jgi:hypothetical protein
VGGGAAAADRALVGRGAPLPRGRRGRAPAACVRAARGGRPAGARGAARRGAAAAAVARAAPHRCAPAGAPPRGPPLRRTIFSRLTPFRATTSLMSLGSWTLSLNTDAGLPSPVAVAG